jgi:hypothetical protein
MKNVLLLLRKYYSIASMDLQRRRNTIVEFLCLQSNYKDNISPYECARPLSTERLLVGSSYAGYVEASNCGLWLSAFTEYRGFVGVRVRCVLDQITYAAASASTHCDQHLRSLCSTRSQSIADQQPATCILPAARAIEANVVSYSHRQARANREVEPPRTTEAPAERQSLLIRHCCRQTWWGSSRLFGHNLVGCLVG